MKGKFQYYCGLALPSAAIFYLSSAPTFDLSSAPTFDPSSAPISDLPSALIFDLSSATTYELSSVPTSDLSSVSTSDLSSAPPLICHQPLPLMSLLSQYKLAHSIQHKFICLKIKFYSNILFCYNYSKT